jgi:hypothetical protein
MGSHKLTEEEVVAGWAKVGGERCPVHSDQSIEQALANRPRTKLEAFFDLCMADSFARSLLYMQVPMHYTWQTTPGNRHWACRRQSGGAVGRMHGVQPSEYVNFTTVHCHIVVPYMRYTYVTRLAVPIYPLLVYFASRSSQSART